MFSTIRAAASRRCSSTSIKLAQHQLGETTTNSRIQNTQRLNQQFTKGLYTTASAAQAGSSSESATSQNPKILLQDKENGFGFARSNLRPQKPRMKGVTEIRGPYYSVRFFFPLLLLCFLLEQLKRWNGTGYGQAVFGWCSRNVSHSLNRCDEKLFQLQELKLTIN